MPDLHLSYDRYQRRLVVRLPREGKPSRYAIITLRKRPTVRWGVEPRPSDVAPSDKRQVTRVLHEESERAQPPRDRWNGRILDQSVVWVTADGYVLPLDDREAFTDDHLVNVLDFVCPGNAAYFAKVYTKDRGVIETDDLKAWLAERPLVRALHAEAERRGVE